MNDCIEIFEKNLEEIGIALSNEQREQFISYYSLLIEWNKKINLTAIVELNDILTKHFLDSLMLVKVVDLNKNISIMDIGTGAGFPGIPLKIIYPNLKITLLDSLNKRVKFLNVVIEELKLKNINALHGRAEDFAKPNLLREEYDLCVSRAVANLSTLSEYCLPYVKVGGKFISYKAEKLNEEIDVAKHAIYLLGGKIIKQESFYLPNTDIYRNLLVIDKINHTAKKFPRKAGLAAKEPLK